MRSGPEGQWWWGSMCSLPHKTGRTFGKHLGREFAPERESVLVRRGYGTGGGQLHERRAVGGADDATQAHFVDNLPVGQQVGEGSHGSAAAGLQGGEQGPLGGHGGPGERVGEPCEQGGEVYVDRRALYSESSLAGSGQDGLDRQHVGRLLDPAGAYEARGGEHDSVVLPG